MPSVVRIHFWKNGDSYMVEGTINKLSVNTAYVTVLSLQGDKKIYIPHIMKIHLYVM